MPLESRQPGGGAERATRLPSGVSAVGTVLVRFFATALELVGEPSLRMDIAEDETVGSILDRLVTAYPALAPMRASLLVAMNYEYVEAGASLSGGEEIALIPPVQGG
jgi:molybdopterin converting factor small subunit